MSLKPSYHLLELYWLIIQVTNTIFHPFQQSNIIIDVLSRGSALKLQSRPSKKGITATLHRCLVALGDIARYKDSTVDKGSMYAGQYMLAKKYYWHALCLLPDHGNTYNQLAVLEAYSDRFTFALDLYFKRFFIDFV